MDNLFSNKFTDMFMDAAKCNADMQKTFLNSMTQTFQDNIAQTNKFFKNEQSNDSNKTDSSTTHNEEANTSYNQFNKTLESVNDYISFITPTIGSFNSSLSEWMLSLSSQPDLINSQKTLIEDLRAYHLTSFNDTT